MNRRLVVAAAVLSLGVLGACGASAPPARELANEMIDTLEFGLDPATDANRIAEIRECMHQEVADFQVAPDAGFESFDDVAAKAAEDQPQAVAIMDEFEAALRSCNGR